MKLKIYLLFFLLLKITAAQNVILVVIDGARYTETFGAADPSVNIPHLWNDLKPQGTLYSNFRNNGITSTNPGHSSLLTGTWQSIENDGSERPTSPTVFEYLRKEKGASIFDAYVITGKGKLDILNYSTDEEYGSDFMASVIAEYISDDSVYSNLTTIMDLHHPKLIIVNFPDVDVAGHSGDSTAYINAIYNVDSLVNELWNKIQADSIYKDNTTLLITNDHGRHTDDFRSHGDNCEGCQHIMLFALGRNIPQNNIITSERTQINIAATIGKLLSFETPFADSLSLFADGDSLSINLNMKIFLEGPYNNGVMSTVLNIPAPQIHYLPKIYMDYLKSPIINETTENDIVDLITVELRTDKDISSDIKKNVYLTSTGGIVDLDGSSPVSFDIIPGNYFIVVGHRNHLSVMSPEAVSFP